MGNIIGTVENIGNAIPATLRGISNALNLPPINQQEGKTVYFMLYTQGRFKGTPVKFVLPINPEDWNFSRSERVHVIQTLGVPFLDDFGTGVPAINIRGITGWRTRLLTGMDGQSAYKFLKQNIIDEYFNQRQLKIDLNLDPDQVRLILINCVDKTSYDVTPAETRLLRNRARPLLYQYDLNFRVLEDLSSDPTCASVTADPLGTALNWLSALVGRIPVLSGVISFASSIASTAISGLQTLCSVAAPFVSGVVAGVGLLTRGVGAVSELLSGVCSSVDTVFQVVKSSSNFTTLGLPSMLAVNHLASTNKELLVYLKKGASNSVQMPNFGRIYGTTDGGSIYSGVADNIGDLALTSASPTGVEWASNLQNAVKSQGSDIIGFTGQAGAPTPYVVNATIGSLIDSMVASAQSLVSLSDYSSVFQAIANVLGAISFNASAIDVSNTYSQSIVNVNAIKVIVTKEGDTLQRIALNELGDASRWKDIAVFNDLVVENAHTVWLPVGTFSIYSDLAPGTNYIDFGYSPPTQYVGCRFTIKDVYGNRQSLIAQSINGTKLYFSGYFSQYLTGPVSLTQYVNRGRLGVFDSQTSLATDFIAGAKTFSVAQSKNIYPDYVLNIQNGDSSGTFTVKSVNYVNQTVTVLEENGFFPANSTVLIFDTETQLHHIEAGMELKIPAAGNNGTSNTVQSDTELYGTDLQLDQEGFLVIGGSGDMATVSGLPNLEQAIQQRIACPYGYMEEHPDYGCGLEAMMGEKGTPVFETAAQATVVDALTHDPRISRVSKIQTTITEDACSIQAKAQSISSGTAEDISASVPLS